MAKKVLVSVPFTDAQKELLKQEAEKFGDDMIFTSEKMIDETTMGGLDGVIGNLNKACLPYGKNLSWMQLNSSGADQYVQEGLLPEDAVLTCATGAYGTGISEYMILMMLSMMKKVPSYQDNQRKGIWRDMGGVTSPIGKRILLVGTGNIGMEFAKRVRALTKDYDPESDVTSISRKTTIVGVRRRAGTCPEGLDEIHTLEELSEEVKKADVIALSLPASKDTFHLFDRDLLLQCKKGSYLLNVGRGNVIDTRALLDPEVSENFAGIWLDVCETEPLPDGDPLFNVANLLITPHICGDFHLDLTVENIFAISMHNYRAWHGQGTYRSVVDRETGYAR